MAELQDLLARLKSSGSQASASESGTASRQHQTSAHLHDPHGSFPSASQPAPEMAPGERQKNLLDLLRFNSGVTSTARPTTEGSLPATDRPHVSQPDIAAHSASGRGYSASDLVASFGRKPSQAAHTPVNAVPGSGRQQETQAASQSPSHTHDFLLKLLNNPKPAQSDASHDRPDLSKTTPLQSPPAPKGQEAMQEVIGSGSKKAAFTYVNPFDQLSASSPRNRTPNPDALAHGARQEHHTGKPDGQAHAGATSPHPGAASRSEQPGSVSRAVADLGQEVDKQVGEALGQQDQDAGIESMNEEDLQAIQEAVKETAAFLKSELRDEDTRSALQETLPKDAIKGLEAAADDLARGNVVDDWESAADSSPTKADHPIQVYNLPLKPFVAISLTDLDTPGQLKPQDSMDIARSKKEFDQIDRTLATASKNYIVYSLVKHGGFRLINQDSGLFTEAFHKSSERIFNLSICRASRSNARMPGAESVIGTGVNGSVFWTLLPSADSHVFEKTNVETDSFIFPPEPAHDDNTSGSQLRTRAKKSSRHPDFFAIGRGRSIHIIFPEIAKTDLYTDPKTRVCDSMAYLKDRCLRIDTGKAGKDFVFSEDDTVIVSLDKAGRMRFWDIRPLVTSGTEARAGETVSIELKEPLLSFTTTAPTDKSWPTSLLFLDKERPTLKGSALRYLIVGMKQNHTLQLWDLGLGKPVQEINFPHDRESDGICSVVYHPRTGMLIVGHPTRNSVYFISVSAPKYHMPQMTQAKFLERLNSRDDPLPTPDSTAIMGSVREFSLSGIGQLRSIDILSDPNSTTDEFDAEAMPLFELYIMHSKGLSCYSIRKSDLGLNKAGKVEVTIDAEEEGHIKVTPIKMFTASQQSDTSTNGEQVPQSSTRSSVRDPKRDVGSRATQGQTSEQAMIATTLARVENKQDQQRAAILNGSDKAEKKKKKRASAAEAPPQSTVSSQAVPQSYAGAVQRGVSPDRSKETLGAAAMPAPSTDTTNAGASAPLATDIVKIMDRELAKLYHKIDEDRRVQDASGVAKQEALLRIVSSTLNENTEHTLSEIILSRFKEVMPSLSKTVTTALDSKFSTAFGPGLNNSVSRELKASLPQSVSRGLQESEIFKNMSEQVSQKVIKSLGSQLSNNMRQAIVPTLNETLKKMVDAAAEKSDSRMSDILRQQQMERQADSVKIDQLTTLVTSLSMTIKSMAESQKGLQRQIADLQYQREDGLFRPGGSQALTIRDIHDPEMEQIVELFNEGMEEQGTVMWLQSERQSELFDNLFYRLDPSFLTRLSPLVSLSVCATITVSFENYLPQRLNWLKTVLESLNVNDPEIKDVSGKILDITIQRLNATYLSLGETDPQNPMLRRIAACSRRSVSMRESLGSRMM